MTTTKTTATVIPFGEICEPGTYVCNWSGHLLQVPENAINGGSPCMNLWSTETPSVTKISNDWNLPVDEARKIAQQCDCPITF